MEHAVLFREDTMDHGPRASLTWRSPRGGLILLGLLALAFLIGPVVLGMAWLIGHWAASESWKARDRWASVGGFALFFGLLAFILFLCLVFPVPWLSLSLSSLWHHFFLLGEYTLSNLLVRWIAGLLLAPALTIVLELVQPRTVWYPGRKLLASEQAQRDSQAESAKAQEVVPAGSGQSTTTIEPSGTTSHSSKTPPRPERSRREGTTQHQRQPVPQERPGKPKPSATQKLKEREQKKPTRQLKPPPAPTYDWNTGEGSLKDL
jgi:hypothetical protein